MISGRTGRAGAVLSKREPTVQNGRVGTYGNVPLGPERILFKEALDRIETDFQKNCSTGLYFLSVHCIRKHNADLEKQN